MNGYYGEAPVVIGDLKLPNWHEFMHYLYLPVMIPRHDRDADRSGRIFALPQRLRFMMPALEMALLDAREVLESKQADLYVYATAKRGFATPGNPLNRPGWHCDDFGGSDLNYVWTDAYPTRVLRSDKPLAIPEDDAESMEQMTWIAAQVFFRGRHGDSQIDRELDRANVRFEEIPTNTLLRLSPWVIHEAPEIIEPGMRSFFKISVSTHRYDLVGNSHNYELKYDWPMYDRQELRNQPGAFQNKDYSGVGSPR